MELGHHRMRAVHLQHSYSALTAQVPARADCALQGELMLERLCLTIPQMRAESIFNNSPHPAFPITLPNCAIASYSHLTIPPPYSPTSQRATYHATTTVTHRTMPDGVGITLRRYARNYLALAPAQQPRHLTGFSPANGVPLPSTSRESHGYCTLGACR